MVLVGAWMILLVVMYWWMYILEYGDMGFESAHVYFIHGLMPNQSLKGTWFQVLQPTSDQIIGNVPRSATRCGTSPLI
jgi:hypothetical protein